VFGNVLTLISSKPNGTLMNTLEQDKELLDKLETEYRKEKHQEYHKNKNREQYHPIGLVSDEIRLENKVAFREWMLEIKPTHFFTFNFNKKFQSSNTETIVSYGKEKLHKFHKYIHKKIFGKYWYKPEIINPNEHIFMVLSPQDISTNLHFHGTGVIRNTKMFPNKVEMFEEYGNRIWNLDNELSSYVFRKGRNVNKQVMKDGVKMDKQLYIDGEWIKKRDVIVPSGSLDIQKPYNQKCVSWYSTRKQNNYQNYEHYYISGSQ
jgi:hypothetical protein